MGLYPEWQAAHPPQPPKARQLAKMHAMYGQTLERTCGECAYLSRVRRGQNAYLKCRNARRTHGPGTDWRRKWQACGLFKEREMSE